MKTPWTDSVDINAPLPEYPRPQMARRSWLNLNGQWLYAFTDSSRRPAEYDVRYNPRYNLIPVIGGLSFGLVIVVKAAVFVGLLKYLFAMLLIVGGLYYVFYLAPLGLVRYVLFVHVQNQLSPEYTVLLFLL